MQSAFMLTDETQQLSNYHLTHNGKQEHIRATLISNDKQQTQQIINGQGDGALSAFCDAIKNHFGFQLEIVHYHQHAIGSGTGASAMGYVQVKINDKRYCGIAKNRDVMSANLNAILVCVKQALDDVAFKHSNQALSS